LKIDHFGIWCRSFSDQVQRGVDGFIKLKHGLFYKVKVAILNT
jgi:hypothetical protein